MSTSPQSPYRPPGAVVADQDLPAGSPAKAVTFGVLVDIVGSVAASFLIMVVYGIGLAAQGVPAEEIERIVANVDPASGVALTASAAGFAFSFVGGYVCARIVRHSELKWAGVVAAISVSTGFVLSMQTYSVERNLLMAVLGVACVLLGGYVGARRNVTKP